MILEIIHTSFLTIFSSPRTIILASLVSLIFVYVLYPLFLSPLRNIPGPFYLRCSRLFSLHYQRTGQWNNLVYELHRQYDSDVIVVGPQELSFNNPNYIKDIYVKNFPKSSFYANFGNHGHENIFSILDNHNHITMRKKLNGVYTKSSILSSDSKVNVLHDTVHLLVRDIYQTSVAGTTPDAINATSIYNQFGKGRNHNDWLTTEGKNLGMEMYFLFSALAMDVVSTFELGFGNGTNLILNKPERKIIESHRIQTSMWFYTTLLPRFWNYAASNDIKTACEDIESWQLSLYDKASMSENTKFESTLQILARNGMEGNPAYSLLSDDIFAGHETTAVQLTYLTYELSRPKNLHLQEKLRTELINEFGTPEKLDQKSMLTKLDIEKVDKLEYLDSILQENLRVHASIPGPEPRITDKPYSVTVNGTKVIVPERTIVSVQPWCVQRNDKIFPDPDSFIPERWMKYPEESETDFKARLFKQKKHMMAFGQGVRMCLGMNLALLEIKLAIANMYWRFNSEICDEWCEITPVDDAGTIKMGSHNYKTSKGSDEEKMVMVDAYTTRPLFDECWLKWYEN